MSASQPEHDRTLREARLRGLVHAVEQLAGAGAMDDVVEIVRTTARRLVGSDGIAMILREEDHCHYVEEDAIGRLWKGQKFPLGSCVSGWAMIHRETVVIPDISQDERVPYDLYRDTFVRSLVMAPVRSGDPIGAIGAYWSESHEPSRDAIETLETLARATATAIENVRLVGALSRALSDAEHARNELRHRVKNAFAAAQALAALSLPSEQARALNTRIAALARAHELIDQKLAHETSIGLAELVEAELDPYRSESPGRLEIVGPKIELESAMAISIGLVLNELATNALKHGALSTRSGRVQVRWRREQQHLVLEWEERDGPEVRAHAIENFGSRLLKRLIEGQLKGTLHRELKRSGVTCVMEVPGVVETTARA
ncbi:MAG: GAF domain-containing protein [Sphingomonadaceae bacterium]|nr:GAF domain-containing protein [Sphingomonadaceae bacterium]